MVRKFISLFLICSFYHAAAQTEARRFETQLISDDGAFGLTISPDSKTALWVKSGGKRDTLIILQSVRANGKWQTPFTASFSNKGEWKDIDPVFSPDGKLVLFQSNRPVPGKPERKGFDIWSVSKTKKGWSEPVHLGNTINSDDSESYASLTKKGHIYFMKENPDGKGKSDIFVSKLINGRYQTSESIGLPVNTTERESNPYISPDEDYLIYFSTAPGGYGEVDLYISFNNKGVWSAPQNLGPSINSALAEFCPFVHQREKRLYFSRQEKTVGRFNENLFHIPFNPALYKKDVK